MPNPDPFLACANALGAGGDDAARACWERALGVKPFGTKALPGDGLITRILQALDMPGIRAADRALLHYAAAKYHDDTGNPEAAIRAAMAAKAVSPASFDMALQVKRLAKMMSSFDEVFFANRIGFGSDSEVPVFLIGMPRSGITLAGKVIASHPQAAVAGELAFLPDLARQLGFEAPDPDGFIAQCMAMSKTDSQVLARAYLDGLHQRFPNARRVVDKMPHNFEQVWLIRLLFPRARIIHCTRDAADTCLSIFIHPFLQADAYAQDLALLGDYYRLYEKLMAHWRSVLPGLIHNHAYEEMVTDPEACLRKLVHACGLPFDPNSFADPNRQRSVTTFDRWRWQRYQPWIGPLLAALSK